jgi:hypothetical protein
MKAFLSHALRGGMVAFLSLLFTGVHAQTGTLAGLVIDAQTAEPLIGAAVYLESDPTVGTATDLDGLFRITNMPVGVQNVVVSYVSYQTKNISGVEIKAGDATNLNITLEESSEMLEAVVVKEEFKAQSVAAVYTMQKKAISVQDGISRDIIARSPDNNTGEVLKRLPGTTIQDGRFAIIRGLSDRYNNAMVNGLMMSSTEPDRKAFAFDLFPSSMMDYLIITKTAQPDLPGEFAGGLIQVATRDIPDENFFEVSLGAGYNTRTTFQPFGRYEGGSTDWLGIDDGGRDIPEAIGALTTQQYTNIVNRDSLAGLASQFSRRWGVDSSKNAPLNRSIQLSGGWSTDIGEDSRFGIIGGVTYRGSNENFFARELNYEGGGDSLLRYADQHYVENVLAGALLNFGFRLGTKHKLNFRNSLTSNSSDRTILREGFSFDKTRAEERYYYEFLTRQLFNTSLNGEHSLGANNIRLDWTVGYDRIWRDQPDSRSLTYAGQTEQDSVFLVALSPIGSFNNAGNFFSALTERTLSGAVNLTLPFTLGTRQQDFKVGGYVQNKVRSFDARIFGYEVPALWTLNYPELVSATPEELFVDDAFAGDGLVSREITNASDSYTGESNLYAAYGMFDNRIGEKLRLVWGLRMERFNQFIETGNFTTDPSAAPVVRDTTYTDFLPSLNLTYSVNDKINIRLSGSQTLARPEFRERALFSYFNFQTFVNVSGNVNLLPVDIYNADLRFEYFPGGGQIVSVSAFYKYFDNPISYIRIPGEGGGGQASTERPVNETFATNIGIEAEIRKNFDFIGVEQLVFNTNLAYIRSRSQIDSANSADAELAALVGPNIDRPLVYQSPWIINVGLSWVDAKGRFDATVLFNTAGSRRILLGNVRYPDILEAPRNILDAQVRVRLLENLHLKLTASDLLAAPELRYWDLDGQAPDTPVEERADTNNRFDEEDDVLHRRIIPGSQFSIGLTWRL